MVITSRKIRDRMPTMLDALKTELERFGDANDASNTERPAGRKLLQMLPDVLQVDCRGLFVADDADREHRELVTAADKLCAYVKCLEESRAGALPEVRYFLDTFVPSFRLTLDELE
jgi:5'-deoxynucleotidase YfbR-like HD superfamily hydrolase